MKFPKSSNIELERKYKGSWKRADTKISHFSHPNMPLFQFLEENNKKSNFITFADIDIKKITSENFDKIIENIISSLPKAFPEKKGKSIDEENTNIPREALLNLIKHGLIYSKSFPIIKLLISLSESSEGFNPIKNCEIDYNDLIIFYLKQICENFSKFDDFLDSMVILSEYLTKALIKSNLDNNDLNNKSENQNSKNGKENGNAKKGINRSALIENEIIQK